MNFKWNWFDQTLKGADTGILSEPPVRLFRMGGGERNRAGGEDAARREMDSREFLAAGQYYKSTKYLSPRKGFFESGARRRRRPQYIFVRTQGSNADNRRSPRTLFIPFRYSTAVFRPLRAADQRESAGSVSIARTPVAYCHPGGSFRVPDTCAAEQGMWRYAGHVDGESCGFPLRRWTPISRRN